MVVTAPWSVVTALAATGVTTARAEALVAGADPRVVHELAAIIRRIHTLAPADEAAARSGGDLPLGVLELRGASLRRLPFREAELDLIVLGNQAEVGSTSEVLAEAARVVSDRGILATGPEGPAAGSDHPAWERLPADDGVQMLRRRARRPSRPPFRIEEEPAPGTPWPEPSDPVLGLARHIPERLVLLDGGCRGGFHERWTQLGPHVHLIGFDPDAVECARMEAELHGRGSVTLVAKALGDEPGAARFFVSREPAGSSLLPPDLEGTAHLGRVEGAHPDRVEETQVVRLDDWAGEAGVTRIDALKLDIEGGELLALRGAPRLLEDVSAVEVEIRFNPNNIGAPLFGEVDALLRSHGFVLWCISDQAHYRLGDSDGDRLPTRQEVLYYHQRDGEVLGRVIDAPPGQIIWANAHWVRESAIRAVLLPWSARLRMAIVARALGLHDLAIVNLRWALHGAPPPATAEAIVVAVEAMGGRR
jgi:FkbM family methyltransferase